MSKDLFLDMESLDDERLGQLFDRVASLVRGSSSNDSDVISNQDRLRLYGLYKVAQLGSAKPADEPPIYQVEARAKYLAWKSASCCNRREAMIQYIGTLLTKGNGNFRKECESIIRTAKDSQLSHESPVAEEFSSDTAVLFDDTKGPGRKRQTIMSVVDAALAWFGIQPLFPRGHIDISLSDLLFGFLQCLWCMMLPNNTRAQTLAEEIERHWKANCPGSPHVIAGLSARSLFDLYFCAKKYPPGSQVIVVPPITVPGMVDVLRHHKLEIVGVDILSDDSIRFDYGDIARAVTDRTVAIVIVHVFGMVCTSDTDMQQLRSLADHHHLDILEDCAECYSGLGTGCYVGSPLADLRLFSFGMIKTATAAGGGVAVARSNDVAKDMVRLSESFFGRQTNIAYLLNLLRCSLLKVTSDSPTLYGVSYAAVSALGFDFDQVAVLAMRGNRRKLGYESVASFRMKPSSPLLSVLLRRLQCHEHSALIVSGRMRRFKNLQKSFDTYDSGPRIVDRPSTAYHSTCWICPVRCSDRNTVSKQLRRHGFDISAGSSQLLCVGDEPETRTPNSLSLMKNILYFPVTNPLMSDVELMRMTKHVCESSNNQQDMPERSMGVSSFMWAQLWSMLVAVLILLLLFWPTRCLQVLFAAGKTLFALLLVGIFALHYLRKKTASFFLQNSSNLFKFSPLLKDSTEEAASANSKRDGNPPFPLDDFYPLPSLVPAGRVLLSGATGFVGSAVLCDLLKWQTKFVDPKGVVILCRGRKGQSARERIDLLLRDPMFSFLSENQKLHLVTVIEADLAADKVGLSEIDLRNLKADLSFSHVIHCAAAVSFDVSLEKAACINIRAPLFLQKIAADSPQPCRFVHVSTAFVHGDHSGTGTQPLPQKLFSLEGHHVQMIYSSMLGNPYYATKAMRALGFPNTYSFSKCICEHLLSLQGDKCDTTIVRPSIVGPALASPCEGWAGPKPSTLVAACCLHLHYQWNLWVFGPEQVPVIPSDVLSRIIIQQCFEKVEASDSDSSEDSYEKVGTSSSEHVCQKFTIVNATWDFASHTNRTLTWTSYARIISQLGAVLEYFDRTTASVSLFAAVNVCPTLDPEQSTFRVVQSLAAVPIRVLAAFLQCFQKGDSQAAKKLSVLAGLPRLFLFFMNRTFYFESGYAVPPCFDSDRYLFSCVVAAHKFMRVRQQVERARLPGSVVSVGGQLHSCVASDAWWALSQPIGSFLFRLVGFTFRKLLRCTATLVTVDLSSFADFFDGLDSNCTIVLAPTHRSFFDFVLLSYISFCLPELGLGMLRIVAADDFRGLPFVGWLAEKLGAFYISRGRKDANLSLRLEKQTGAGADQPKSAIELFVEGRRSRDRRFLPGKTGFIKSLEGSSDKCLYLPITINYDVVPEQEALLTELREGRRTKLSLRGLFSWVVDAVRGRVSLGRIHIVAGKPVRRKQNASDTFEGLVGQIQREQRLANVISQYHVTCTALLLDMAAADVRQAFLCMGARFIPGDETLCASPSSIDQSLLFIGMLQSASLLSSLLRSKGCSEWAGWFDSLSQEDRCSRVKLEDKAVNELVRRLTLLLEKTTRLVKESEHLLSMNGFSQPSADHIFQECIKGDKTIPVVLIRAAVGLSLSRKSLEVPGMAGDFSLQRTYPRSDVGIGFWGFRDSRFVAKDVGPGYPVLEFTGNRYFLSGKRFPNLLPFIEEQLRFNIDLAKEAFPGLSSDIDASRSCRLDQHELDALEKSVSKVSIDVTTRTRHGTGHSLDDVYRIRSNAGLRIPDAVVWPSCESEVCELVRLARANEWSLIPFGGGTNVTGATCCPSFDADQRSIISVDMRQMNKLIQVNEEDGFAVVEAGITGRALALELAAIGLTAGHEPDSYEFSTVGGWIATKASGMKRNKYGNIEDIVTKVHVVSAGGTLWSGGESPSPCSRSAEGMDAKTIIIGSEGCLGIITQATIRVWPKPIVCQYDSILFPTWLNGTAFMRDVAKLDRGPCSVRLLDNQHFRLGKALAPESRSLRSVLQSTIVAGRLLCKGTFSRDSCVCASVTFEGTSEDVLHQRSQIQILVRMHSGVSVGESIGFASYQLTFMIAYLRDFALTYHVLGESFETFAPWSRLDRLVESTKDVIYQEHSRRHLPGRPFIGCRVTQTYHDGACVYFYFAMTGEGVPNPVDVYKEIEKAAREEILRQGGSLSHHHGIGKHRAPLVEQRCSRSLLLAVNSLKRSLDPSNVFGARNGMYANYEVVSNPTGTSIRLE